MLGDGIRRSIEPGGVVRGLVLYVQSGGILIIRCGYGYFVRAEAYGNNDACADVRAAPFMATTPKFFPDPKFFVFHARLSLPFDRRVVDCCDCLAVNQVRPRLIEPFLSS
jgi:hypothetical protein